MFHPLIPDLKDVKDIDLEKKVHDLSNKYSIAAESGNGYLCDQIIVILTQYKEEQQKRFNEKSKRVKDQDINLDNLINIA